VVDTSPVRGLVERLERRQRELDARELELDARVATLRTLERAVTDAVVRREAAGPGGSALGTSCRLRGGVTKIYEQMRAEQAAAILDRLDDETLRIVFASMEVRRIGAILAEMSRERAVAFTRTLARDAANVPLQTVAVAPAEPR
jgi:flagellar motility protein MotE (MotC chaperone)